MCDSERLGKQSRCDAGSGEASSHQPTKAPRRASHTDLPFRHREIRTSETVWFSRHVAHGLHTPQDRYLKNLRWSGDHRLLVFPSSHNSTTFPQFFSDLFLLKHPHSIQVSSSVVWSQDCLTRIIYSFLSCLFSQKLSDPDSFFF